MKKKPLAVVKQAHQGSVEGGGRPWISAIAALTNTDLLVSGCYICLYIWRGGD